MWSPATATAAFSITRRCASMVTTQRALQMASTGVGACANAAGTLSNQTKLQVRRIKRPWEQLFEPQHFTLAAQIYQHNFDVAAKLPQDLAARPARRRERLGIGGDRDAPELTRAFGNRLKHGHALRAECQSISRVLDIAAGMHSAARIFERGAHAKFRIRSMRIFARRQRGGLKGIGHSVS